MDLAYQIIYGKRAVRRRIFGWKRMLLIGAVAVAVIVGFRVSKLYDRTVEALLPGSGAAFEVMAKELQAGEDFAGAFYCFCQEIIEDAR